MSVVHRSCVPHRNFRIFPAREEYQLLAYHGFSGIHRQIFHSLWTDVPDGIHRYSSCLTPLGLSFLSSIHWERKSFIGNFRKNSFQDILFPPSAMFDFQKIFAYVRFLDEFRKIKRVMYNTGEDRLENDTEHSYQLTMLAWYIIDAYKLDLDKNLVIRYCLVHDLVEVYAGDTYIYSQDKEHFDSKAKREEEALVQIEKEFSEFPDIFRFIEQYEHRNDRESLFVYALDKIIPVLHIYTDDGRTWKDVELTEIVITIEKLREMKDEKIK